MYESMVTTEDNPFDPFENFDEWYAWDFRAGYNTPSYLARITVTSDSLSPVDQRLAIEYAVDEIVHENILGIYKKVTREIESDFETSV